MPDNLPGPPARTIGQSTQTDLDQTKIYLDVLRRMVEINEAALSAIATGAIPASIIDAKGDLIVGTAADTPARKSVEANRTILEADSTQGDGMAWAARALGLKSTQVFTASGTWTRPTGIRKVVVEVVGGGAGGQTTPATGAGQASGGGGGGGGGYARKLIDVSTIATATITVGAGGASAAAGGASSWADGTNTVTGNGGAVGGPGGAAAPPSRQGGGGAGGTATGGDVNVTGSSGTTAFDLSNAVNAGDGGAGGGTVLGGQTPARTGTGTGTAGGQYGTGGGGAHADASAAAQNGGAGAAGVIIVWEFE